MVIDITKAREAKENKTLVAECIRDEASILQEALAELPEADERQLMFMLEYYRTMVRLKELRASIEEGRAADGKALLVEHVHETMLFSQIAANDLGIDMREIVREASAMPDTFA